MRSATRRSFSRATRGRTLQSTVARARRCATGSILGPDIPSGCSSTNAKTDASSGEWRPGRCSIASPTPVRFPSRRHGRRRDGEHRSLQEIARPRPGKFRSQRSPTDGHRFIADDVMECSAAPRAQGRKIRRHHPRSADFLALAHAGRAFQVEQDFEKLLLAALEVAERDARILLSTNCTRLNERALESYGAVLSQGNAPRRKLSIASRPCLIFHPEWRARSVWLTLR